MKVILSNSDDSLGIGKILVFEENDVSISISSEEEWCVVDHSDNDRCYYGYDLVKL